MEFQHDREQYAVSCCCVIICVKLVNLTLETDEKMFVQSDLVVVCENIIDCVLLTRVGLKELI